jgi:hypothetical protein
MNIPSIFLSIFKHLHISDSQASKIKFLNHVFKLQIITVKFYSGVLWIVPSKKSIGFRQSSYLKDLKTRFFLFFFLALASWIQPWMIFFSLFLASTTESGSAGLEALTRKTLTKLKPVLRIRDVFPRSRIPDPGTNKSTKRGGWGIFLSYRFL